MAILLFYCPYPRSAKTENLLSELTQERTYCILQQLGIVILPLTLKTNRFQSWYVAFTLSFQQHLTPEEITWSQADQAIARSHAVARALVSMGRR